MQGDAAHATRPRALQARWVFPIQGPPIADGVVTVAGGSILSVGTRSDVSDVTDLGNVALLPGLVNCHTHLEFSDFPHPLGQAGMRLPDWIEQVVAYRRWRAEEGMWDARQAIAAGLREGWSTGTAVVGEIGTQPWLDYACASDTREALPHVIRFGELLGLGPQTVETLCAAARQQVELPRVHMDVGLSPHAPYTVHPQVLECAIRISANLFVPIAMHLAESPEEMELLANRSGAFIKLLTRLHAWHPESLIYSKPLDYLQRLAAASRALVIHGNYLDASEQDFLGQHHDRMSVVYCPRTHAYFRHARYPLESMLAAGVRVVVGTDSRASNPDLSLFEELRYIAAQYPAIEPQQILRMGTDEAAAALGLQDDYGAIQCGRRAIFAAARLPENAAHDPYEALWMAEHIEALSI